MSNKFSAVLGTSLVFQNTGSIVTVSNDKLELDHKPSQEDLMVLFNALTTENQLGNLRVFLSNHRGKLDPQLETEIKQEIALLEKLSLVRNNRANEIRRQLQRAAELMEFAVIP